MISLEAKKISKSIRQAIKLEKLEVKALEKLKMTYAK